MYVQFASQHYVRQTVLSFSSTVFRWGSLFSGAMLHKLKLPRSPWSPIYLFPAPQYCSTLVLCPSLALHCGKYFHTHSLHGWKAGLICFHSLRDHSLLQPVVRRLKTVVSYIFSDFLVVYSQSTTRCFFMATNRSASWSFYHSVRYFCLLVFN